MTLFYLIRTAPAPFPKDVWALPKYQNSDVVGFITAIRQNWPKKFLFFFFLISATKNAYV